MSAVKVNSASTMAEHPHSNPMEYTIVNGIVITPELIEKVKSIQEDFGAQLAGWKSETFDLISTFLDHSCDMEAAKRLECIETICSLIEFASSMRAPREFMMKERRA